MNNNALSIIKEASWKDASHELIITKERQSKAYPIYVTQYEESREIQQSPSFKDSVEITTISMAWNTTSTSHPNYSPHEEYSPPYGSLIPPPPIIRQAQPPTKPQQSELELKQIQAKISPTPSKVQHHELSQSYQSLQQHASSRSSTSDSVNNNGHLQFFQRQWESRYQQAYLHYQQAYMQQFHQQHSKPQQSSTSDPVNNNGHHQLLRQQWESRYQQAYLQYQQAYMQQFYQQHK